MEFSFERQAMEGKPLPQGLDIADSCAYMSLKHLYAMYRKCLISRNDAKKEKESIVYNWMMAKSKLDFLDRKSDVLKEKISHASEEYAKNPTIENADRLYAAFYNFNENWRKGNE